jgi:hypothetical protein
MWTRSVEEGRKMMREKWEGKGYLYRKGRRLIPAGRYLPRYSKFKGYI